MDRLREEMLFKIITIIDPDDLFVDPTSNDKSHLAKFRYKEKDEGIENGDELSPEFKPDYILLRSQLAHEANRRTAKKRIFNRRTRNLKITAGKLRTFYFFYSLIISFIILLYSFCICSKSVKLKHTKAPSPNGGFQPSNSLEEVVTIKSDCSTRS